MFDGEGWRWVEATWTNQLHEPAVAGIVGNLRDITDRKRSGAFAQAQTRVLELVLSGAPVPETLTVILEAVEDYVPDGAGSIRLYDPDEGTLVCVAAPSLPDDYVRAVGELTTLEEVEAAFRETGLRVTPDIEHDGARPAVAELCVAHGLRGLWSMPIRTPDGSDFLGVFSFFLRTVREPEPEQLAVLERARDLVAVAIDRDARTKELGHLALHDTLTGLPNRALVQDRIEHALARLADGDDDAMVAVLFVDLDRFKLVNDGLGHETGDELLAAVSRRLSTSVRRQDTVARFGGDEFVVLCEDLSDERQAVELAERAAHAFVEPFVLSHAEVAVSASIGIAVTRRTSERASTLLQDADAAMYRAKRRGGARHELFDEAMRTQAVSRLLTERALRRALQQDELRVLFQPQFELATGRRIAVEALLRWNHPVRGLVMPGDFLRVAEETGIIVPIGEWVLERACDLLRSPAADGPRASGCRSRPTSPPDSCSGPTSRPRGARVAGLRGRPGPTLPRGGRERAARRPRCNRRHAPRAQGARRTARHRRLRHRRVVPDLPAPVPVRRAEDPQHVRGGARPQRGRRRDRRRHHRHGPRARHDRGRRGRRDGRATRPPARARLRPCAGLSPRAARGARGAATRARRAASRRTLATSTDPQRRERSAPWVCSTRSRKPRRRAPTSRRKASRPVRTRSTSRS